jgi:hypothetical protein
VRGGAGTRHRGRDGDGRNRDGLCRARPRCGGLRCDGPPRRAAGDSIAMGGIGMGCAGPRRACVQAIESGAGGVVLGSGATGSMETSPRPSIDDRPAARAVGAVPRLKGFGRKARWDRLVSGGRRNRVDG